jgi:dTDP-4-dehydrorhamnose reductase
MRLLLTGTNGTLAPSVASVASRLGWEVIAWNRQLVDPADEATARTWLDQLDLNAICHLATGSEQWAFFLATFARQNGLPFLFTSSAMVFHHEPDGPHYIDSPRNAQDEYGRYKIRCEDMCLAANSAAVILRIGWQINPDRAGNNMIAALDQWQTKEGEISASRRWRPACSFMEDTGLAIVELLKSNKGGVFHFDSNANEGATFVQIVHALKVAYGKESWKIREQEEYVHDQRLIGTDLLAPPLSLKLPSLKTG